jgi:hypothetical protein
MVSRIVLYSIALVVGLASGPWSLQSTAQSEPPLTWAVLPIVFIGCVVGIVFVIGFQMLVSNSRAALFASRAFRAIGIYLAGAGFTAGIWAMVFGGGAVPHAFMFLVMGFGVSAGVSFCQLLFASKWSAI